MPHGCSLAAEVAVVSKTTVCLSQVEQVEESSSSGLQPFKPMEVVAACQSRRTAKAKALRETTEVLVLVPEGQKAFERGPDPSLLLHFTHRRGSKFFAGLGREVRWDRRGCESGWEEDASYARNGTTR
jgi:hypothetical protein